MSAVVDDCCCPCRCGASGLLRQATNEANSSWPVLERWYNSSGGYTRAPASLQGPLAAGQPVIIEAGAIIPSAAEECSADAQAVDGGYISGSAEAKNSSSSGSGNVGGSGSVGRAAALTRWLLSYSAADGLLQSARLERYQL
uniref:Uncharacterized protein n=1 Tax=Tetradesmus obliquus TaxID=3088 RepID=A0A383W7W5_TETOB